MFVAIVGRVMRFVEEHKVLVSMVIACGFLLTLCYHAFFKPPAAFPHDTIITIESGSSFYDIADTLEESNVIRSPFLLRLFIFLWGNEKGIIAGDYLFLKPENVSHVARRIARGDFELRPVRVTIPEGSTVAQIATLLETSLRAFPTKQFLDLAEEKEGYLFPDTYFFPPNAKPETVIAKMAAIFEDKITTLRNDMDTFGHSLFDIVTMASLLEKEARTKETRRMISGILWKRLQLNMPLQVDAPFLSINGKSSRELTIDDLAIDSPYNTYKYRGLPKGPIGNPGLEALLDAVTPIQSPYLYYLADKNGVTHYAKTFEEHKHNKELYLY